MRANLLTAYLNHIYRWRWLVVGVCLAVTLIAGAGIRHIEFASDYKVWFGENNPELLAFEKLEKTYTSTHNLIFVVKPEAESVFNTHTLQLLEQLTHAGWRLPYASRAESLINFQHSHAEGDDVVIDDLVGSTDSLTPEDIERIKQIALSEPMLSGSMIDKQGRAALVIVTLTAPETQNRQAYVEAIIAASRHLAERMQNQFPGHRVGVTGTAVLDHAFTEATQHDLKTLIPILHALIFFITFLLLRSYAAVGITMMIVSFSIIIAMGLAGWLGIKLSPGSAAAPLLILTLGIADSVHILVSFLEEAQHEKDRKLALKASMRINFSAVFVTNFTTLIGFLTLNFTDSPPFHDLGNIASMGVAAVFIFSITLLPACVALISLHPSRAAGVNVDKPLAMFANLATRRPRMVIGLVVTAFALCASFIPRIDFNDNFVEYFDSENAFRKDTELLNNYFGSLHHINYSLPSQRDSGITDPVFLENVETFKIWLQQQPEVHHVLSFTDVLRRLNKNLHGDDPAYQTLPVSPEQAGQYILLYEMGLPFGLDANNVIDMNKSAMRMDVTFNDITTRELREFKERADGWLVHNIPAIAEAKGTSGSVMFAYISQRNIEGMINGTAVSFVLISFILIFILRSLKYGLISLIPNMLPAIAAMGIWGIFVGQVGMGASTVAAMTMGIIVDDTVHFLMKYLIARREKHLDNAAAIHYAFHHSGKAMVLMSTILVCGFLVLAASDFRVNVELASLNAIIITVALFSDLLLLPALLTLINRKQPSDENK